MFLTALSFSKTVQNVWSKRPVAQDPLKTFDGVYEE